MKSILLAIPTLMLCTFAACEKKPGTVSEKIEDKAKDGLDARPHEKLRDAGEDIKDAAKDLTK